jgi:hypothetical protein
LQFFTKRLIQSQHKTIDTKTDSQHKTIATKTDSQHKTIDTKTDLTIAFNLSAGRNSNLEEFRPVGKVLQIKRNAELRRTSGKLSRSSSNAQP